MRRVLQAVVLAGALVLTSGCALTDRAGAAAVVDGARYTETQLSTDFANLDKALGKTARPGSMEEVNRNFISIFVSDKILQKAIAKQGVEPNKVTIGKLHRSLVKQLGSAKALDAFAAARGIAPNQIWKVLTNSVLTTDLGAKLIGGTNTTDQNNAAAAYLQIVAKTMNIEVAARFGAWDPKQMLTVAAADDLSAAAK
jgi:hypothetical protein